MRRPRYGWHDTAMRVTAGATVSLATINTVAGEPLWSVAWVATSLGLVACSEVARLRQDIRVVQTGEVHTGQNARV